MLRHQLLPHSAVKIRGVGMIEVLVALFVLSVGILGVASLQFISSFSNTDAMNRTQAVLVAQQFAERLRASAVSANDGGGVVVDNAYFTDIYNFSGLSGCTSGSSYNCHCLTLPASVTNCGAQTCTAAQQAAFDAYELSCALSATSPQAAMDLNCDDRNAADADTCSIGSRHQIRVSWPSVSWQEQWRGMNDACDSSHTDEPEDCVIVELVL